VLRYRGIPSGARLFVPDAIAGSNAVTPTAAGDFGGSQSGGAYAPSSSGSLLLSRVDYADANGGGGQPVVPLASLGPGTTSFDRAAELTVRNGEAMAVYEVLDANPFAQESGQIPTFVAVSNPPADAVIQLGVSLGPISAEPFASPAAPLPRFAAVDPPSDCPALGDCDAPYFPRLEVIAEPLQFSAFAGGAANQRPGYIAVRNEGGGFMSWTAAVTYRTGAGWLTLDVTSGVNNRSIQVYPTALRLGAGSYEAVITIDASPNGGLVNLPVTFRVLAPAPSVPAQPAAPAPPVTPARTVNVTGIANSANFVFAAIAPGSRATVMGSNLSGASVSVAFDGLAARVLEASDSRIQVLVPAALGAKTSAQLVVTVDGIASPPSPVVLAPVAPAIFAGRIANEDHSLNGADSPAAPGSVLEIHTTGLAAVAGGLTVKIHDRDGLVPLSFGPAAGSEGIEVLQVRVPDGLPAMLTDMVVCAPSGGGEPVCSHPSTIAIGAAR
jgi:uncharacterized protein (TIGR03437 family)